MIEIDQLQFSFPNSQFRLAIPSLTLGAGQHVAVIGPSGAGKTTLLNLIAGIYAPDSGTCRVNGTELTQLGDRELRQFRMSTIGLVFQQFELLEYLHVIDNILLPVMIARGDNRRDEMRSRAEGLAVDLGIGELTDRFPHQLSQGEQQRVAIARAMLNQPSIILADEPTGNLDPANKRLILDMLIGQTRQRNQTLIVVTHDLGIIDRFDRTIDFESLTVADHDPLPSVEI